MWHVSFNSIEWNKGILVYDGDPYETYMAVNGIGKLKIGLKCLEYFATYGVPYEDMVILYGRLCEENYNSLNKKLWGDFKQPLNLCKDILINNRKEDQK